MKKIVTMFVMILSVLAISCANDSTDSGSSSGGGGGNGKKTINLDGILKDYSGLNVSLTHGYNHTTGLTGTLTSLTWNENTKTFTSQTSAITAITTSLYTEDSIIDLVSQIFLYHLIDSYPEGMSSGLIFSPTVIKPEMGGADGKWKITFEVSGVDDGWQFENGESTYTVYLVLKTV